MNEWQALSAAVQEDFQDFTDVSRLGHVLVRLAFAALLGGLLGYQRETVGKSAGLRTHMLVTLGAAFYVLVPQLEGMAIGDMSRVLQGLVTGIGFLGGGAILKATDEKEIYGLTTAAGIWVAAAIGIAAGMGRMGTAAVGLVLALAILSALGRMEKYITSNDAPG